jgi:hypothetical protein
MTGDELTPNPNQSFPYQTAMSFVVFVRRSVLQCASTVQFVINGSSGNLIMKEINAFGSREHTELFISSYTFS